MERFNYLRANSADSALKLKARADSTFVAGGTNVVDLLKLNVHNPQHLIDINRIGLDKIQLQDDGSVHVGAMVRNSDLANHPDIKQRFAVLSEALLSGASPQLRNMATTGGNLLQKTRCPYFRDVSFACNKRDPGSGCSAIEGHNRNQAILGTSASCIAANPSDMNVALMALDAVIHLESSGKKRSVSIHDFYRTPESTPHLEFNLEPGELITGVTIPALSGKASGYVKIRDRETYEFALASCAAVVDTQGDHINKVSLAFGGVGTVPWRARKAEAVLNGQTCTDELLKSAADAELAQAKTYSENGFKLDLFERCLKKAVNQLIHGSKS